MELVVVVVEVVVAEVVVAEAEDDAERCQILEGLRKTGLPEK